MKSDPRTEKDTFSLFYVVYLVYNVHLFLSVKYLLFWMNMHVGLL